VSIPDSVDYIGDSAFSGCNSLSYVSYLGTKDPGVSSTDVFAGCGELRHITVNDNYRGNMFCRKLISKRYLYVEITVVEGVKADLIDMSVLAKIICETSGEKAEDISLFVETDTDGNVVRFLVYVDGKQTANSIADRVNEKKEQCKKS